MPGSPQIAPALYDDLPHIAAIHVKSWQETYAGQVRQDYLDSLDVQSRLRKWQEGFAAQTSARLLLARVDGSPVGFISFGPARDPDSEADAEIYAVYLLKRHWGAGIGYSLYHEACTHFRTRGFRKAYLWVLSTNKNAIQAYQRWGGIPEYDRLKDHVIGSQSVKEIRVLFDVSK